MLRQVGEAVLVVGGDHGAVQLKHVTDRAEQLQGTRLVTLCRLVQNLVGQLNELLGRQTEIKI